MQARLALLAAAVAAVLGCAAVDTAGAASPAQAIANLNAARALNGIPAGIVERADLDAGCAHHNAYEQANGGTLTHNEDPSKPGYTSDGAYAGQHSVLSRGKSWDTGDPWEWAPIHLAQLLAPRLDATGVDDGAGYTCAQTLASRNRPAPPSAVTYTYPGNGTSTIYASETAAEGPYTPGQQVGIPAGTRTGPYLYVFFDGPWSVFASARLTSAALTGPSGPVAIATADDTTPGLTGYIPTGAMIIPRAPLAGGATYSATVSATVTDSGGTATPVPVSYGWSFATAPAPPTGPAPGSPAPGGRSGRAHRRCLVPDVRGRDLASARARLRLAGCALGSVLRPRPGGHRGPQRVVSQRPRAGTSAPAGTRVKLVLK